MNTTTLIPFDYHSAVITFTGDAYVNLTQLCAAFNTAPAQFLRLESAKSFMIALAADTGLSDVQNLHISDGADSVIPGLVVTIKGNFKNGTAQGTWAHPDLALECARWLSPEFAIWTNRVIRSVLAGRGLPGGVAVSDADHAYAAKLEAEKRAKWQNYATARARAYIEADVPGNASIRAYAQAARLPLTRFPAANVGGLCKLWAQARRIRIGHVRQQTGTRAKRSLVSTFPPALIHAAWLHFGYEHEQPALEKIEELWRPMLPLYHRLHCAALTLPA